LALEEKNSAVEMQRIVASLFMGEGLFFGWWLGNEN